MILINNVTITVTLLLQGISLQSHEDNNHQRRKRLQMLDDLIEGEMCEKMTRLSEDRMRWKGGIKRAE